MMTRLSFTARLAGVTVLAVLLAEQSMAIREPEPCGVACECVNHGCAGWADGFAAFERYQRGETDGTVFTDPVLADPRAAAAFQSAYKSHPNACPDVDLLAYQAVRRIVIRSQGYHIRDVTGATVLPATPRGFPVTFGFAYDFAPFQPKFGVG